MKKGIGSLTKLIGGHGEAAEEDRKGGWALDLEGTSHLKSSFLFGL